MQKIFITGGSGLFGVNAIIKFRKNYCIFFLINKKKIKLKKSKSINLENKNLFHILKKIKPDYLLHAAAMTNIEDCEKFKKKAHDNNVLFTRKIYNICKKLNIKLVYLSTDQVYNSNKKYKTEKNKTVPINNYGRSKLKSEKIVLKNKKNLVLRTNFYGCGTKYRDSFSDYVIKNLKKKNKIYLFSDVYFTPIYVETLLDYIEVLLKNNKFGIFNLVGTKRMSKYQFGISLAKKFNLNPEYIVKDNFQNRSNLVQRPLELSLSINKFRKLKLIKKLSSFQNDLEKLKVFSKSRKYMELTKI